MVHSLIYFLSKMKASTYLSKALKDQLSLEDLEYIDTLQHGSSLKLREIVTDTAMRIIESRKYPKNATCRDINIAGRDVKTHSGENQVAIKKISIGIIVTVIGGIIVYAITQWF